MGGSHYQRLDPAPWDVVIAWKLGYLEGTALKYIARWRDKGGIEDIRKAIHFLEKLVEVETQHEKVPNANDLSDQLRRALNPEHSLLYGPPPVDSNLRSSEVAYQSSNPIGDASLNETQVVALRELAQQSHFGDYGNLLVPSTASALGGFRRVHPVDEQTGDSLPTDGLLNDTSGFDALHMRE